MNEQNNNNEVLILDTRNGDKINPLNGVQLNKKRVFIIEFRQDDLKLKETLTLDDKTDFSKVVGTVVNRLFTVNDRMKKYSTCYFKATKDVHFTIESDAIKLDTFKIQEKFYNKMRFGNTAKSRKKFALSVYTNALDMISDIVVKDMKELVGELEDKQTLEQAIANNDNK